MRDFENIMRQHKYFKEESWNRTDSIYTFETGSKIEFFSADQDSKVKGPRRDRLFINEANNVPFGVFDQLEVRTKEFVFLDWNPTNEFWFYTEVVKRSDVELLILNYKDNEALAPSIIASIEQRKGNKNWWTVYGEGKLGLAEGLIYRGWLELEDVPHEARLERRGLDFGYTNDPTAIVALFRWNGGFIFDEETFLKGLSNKMISDRVLASPEPKALVLADSAEPKSIDEIKNHGVNIIGAIKGAGSLNQGIQFVQDQKIWYTKRSDNIRRESRNYMWQMDSDGKLLNIPEAGFDHTMDAIRYALSSYQPATEDIAYGWDYEAPQY
jgi:phage terminase large subunit